MDPPPWEGNLLRKSTERMLPTPVKTPSKKEIKRNIKPASRLLFPHGLNNKAEDVVPRRTRMSLYSPGLAPQVEVYTDVNARLPELDESEENVFYDNPEKRRARAKARAKNSDEIEKQRKEYEQNAENEKGMWFTL